MENIKKTNLTIKLYPIFYALSADLIFFVPIDTLFYTLAKGLNASEISAITTIGLLVCILSQKLILFITKKIGNVNSVRLGALLFLSSMILLIFGKSFISIALFLIINELGYMFWNMTNILLRNDLISINKESDYFLIRNKAKIGYGILTMITALMAGYLFNINNYIPIYLSTVLYLIVFILSFMLYEVKGENKEKKIKDKRIKINKLSFLVIISSAFFYGIIRMGQGNSKLFMQYDFQKVLSTEMVTYYITTIVFISRIARIVGNIIFSKLYLKIKDKISTVLTILLCMAFFVLIMGHYISISFTFKVITMAFGFFLILAIRDSFQVYIEDIALKVSNKQNQQQIMISISASRKLVRLILSLVSTLILLKYELVVIEIILLILSVFEFYINKRMIKRLNNYNS